MNGLTRIVSVAAHLSPWSRLHFLPSLVSRSGDDVEMAERLTARSETISGVWMRRIDLENPSPQ